MIQEILNKTEENMKKAIEALDIKYINIRAGRANPALLDDVVAEYYGVLTPLKQLATISVPEARKLVIKPFDRSAIGAMEKAIFESNIGLTPNNNGETIIVEVPLLTEERRLDLVKQAKQMTEESKIVLRNIRQDSNTEIKSLSENEDSEKRAMDDVQHLINKYNKEIDEVFKEKEKELMTI